MVHRTTRTNQVFLSLVLLVSFLSLSILYPPQVQGEKRLVILAERVTNNQIDCAAQTFDDAWIGNTPYIIAAKMGKFRNIYTSGVTPVYGIARAYLSFNTTALNGIQRIHNVRLWLKPHRLEDIKPTSRAKVQNWTDGYPLVPWDDWLAFDGDITIDDDQAMIKNWKVDQWAYIRLENLSILNLNGLTNLIVRLETDVDYVEPLVNTDTLCQFYAGLTTPLENQPYLEIRYGGMPLDLISFGLPLFSSTFFIAALIFLLIIKSKRGENVP